MNKAFNKLIIATALSLLVSAAANADPYVIGKLGGYFPDEDAFDTGFGMRGAFGMSFRDLGFGADPRPGSWLDKLMVEAGFGYYTADVDRAGENGDLTVLPVTVSGVLVHRLPTVPIELRAGVGIGTYFAEFDASFKDKSTVKQGLYLNAGAVFNLSEKLGVLADIDYDRASGDVGGWVINGGVRYRF